jgi:hypothetical protein
LLVRKQVNIQVWLFPQKTKQFQNWFYCSGRELQGVQFAMDFLEKNQKKQLGKDF